MSTTKPKAKGTRRRRKPGKRIELLMKRAPDRAVAIDAALKFLMAAVRQERLSLALGSATANVGEWHTENRLLSELAGLPTIESMRRTDAVTLRKIKTEVDTSADRMADALSRSLPDDFRKEREEQEFAALHDHLKSQVRYPFAVPPAAVTMIERERQKKIDVIWDLLEQQAGPKEIQEKQKELEEFDPLPREPVFPSETKLRKEIGERMKISKGTVIALAKRTGRIAKK